MARNSTIEWTQVTWNPVVGCSKVSEGCRHCYAETMSRRLAGMARADLAAEYALLGSWIRRNNEKRLSAALC